MPEITDAERRVYLAALLGIVHVEKESPSQNRFFLGGNDVTREFMRLKCIHDVLGFARTVDDRCVCYAKDGKPDSRMVQCWRGSRYAWAQD